MDFFFLEGYATHPPRLGKSLCRQINNKSPFVFSNRYGGSLLSTQVNDIIKAAGREAGIEDVVTSASLRPQLNKKKTEEAERRYQMEKSVEGCLDPITNDEWKEICELIPLLKKRGRGVKPIYSSLDMMNAILYKLRTQCPFRKLPDQSPPWKAVDSQLRRWKRTGILHDLFLVRKKNMPWNSTTK